MNLIETIENKLIALINKEAIYDIDGSNMNLEEIKILTELLKVAKRNTITYINTPNIDYTSIPKYKPTPYWYNNTITCEKK